MEQIATMCTQTTAKSCQFPKISVLRKNGWISPPASSFSSANPGPLTLLPHSASCAGYALVPSCGTIPTLFAPQDQGAHSGHDYYMVLTQRHRGSTTHCSNATHPTFQN